MTDPRLLANLAALQEAAALIEAEVPEPTPEEIRAAEVAARLADQERKRRPTPEESARAWKARNGEYKRRGSITITHPEDAVRLWLKGVRGRTGGDRPTEPGHRAGRQGQTAEEQVIEKVQQTYLEFDYAEGLEAAILRWPLPMKFYDAVAPLCGVEEELLADPRPYEPPPEKETEEHGPSAEDYLMPGWRREEEGNR